MGLRRLADLLNDGAQATKGTGAVVRLLLVLVRELRLELREGGALEADLCTGRSFLMRTCFARAGARHWEGAGGVRNRTRSAALTPETHVVAAASRSSGVAAEKRAEKSIVGMASVGC